MRKIRWAIPLRLKIVMLMAGALTVSLLSYLYVGTTLTVEDKVSYIYDYNLNRVETAAHAIESQISRTLTLEKALAQFLAPTMGNGEREAARALYQQGAPAAGIQAMYFLRELPGGAFESPLILGDSPKAPVSLLTQLGWTASLLSKSELSAASLDGGSIALGSRGTDRQGLPVFLLAVLKPEIKTPESSQKAMIALADSAGAELASRSNLSHKLDATRWNSLLSNITQGTFPSGVRDWADEDGAEYIVGYQRVPGSRLVLVGMVPRKEAFSAAEVLFKRSLALGVSILLLAVGMTLIFVKRLTRNLRQMWEATQKVSQGDFSARVSLERQTRDEVGDLAVSFNAMADKIDELMIQTANKAALEKELETAQAVQNGLFPEKAFILENVLLVGKSIPATKCGGDWWNHVKIGNHLLFLIGDVTGHGVSSALLTASAHGAFCAYVRMYQSAKARVPSLRILVEYMNAAIRDAAKGESSMTAFVGMLDVTTGLLTYVNLSHRAPYHCQKPQTGTPINVSQDLTPLMDAQHDALGLMSVVDLKPAKVQLAPGDLLFLYTDGLVECQNDKGQAMRPMTMLRHLAGLHETSNEDAGVVCDGILKNSLDFLGEKANALSDDITVVVLTIPSTAQFSAKPAEAA